jgi:hypothetical protein
VKRTRLFTIGASTALVVATAIGGGLYLTRAPQAHASAPNPYQVTIGALKNAHPHYTALHAKGPEVGHAHVATSTCVTGLDSLTNFCGQYTVAGADPNGNPNSRWSYNMVGNAPSAHGSQTTTFNAPIIPVRVELLNPDGSVAYTYDPEQYVKPVLKSPVFSNARYSSSVGPTQFTDAVQRAEFYNQASPDWHTLLNANVKPEETMALPAGSYYFALNQDGTCCQFVLADATTFQNLLFPPTYPVDNSTVIGAAELSKAITTQDISTFLFPNSYLYVGNLNNCCILGFHNFDFEPGATGKATPRAYVVNYSSWISPGIFGGGFEDVTALSHEMSETFNDPFVTAFNNLDVTPWWTSGGNCQDNLEVGDVVEGLDNPTYPITTNGYTYHPQTEALLQWFESNGASNAIHGAYSYPNESVLTSSNVSQTANCGGPFS